MKRLATPAIALRRSTNDLANCAFEAAVFPIASRSRAENFIVIASIRRSVSRSFATWAFVSS